MTAEELVAALDLAPHPEGGWYRRTWADQTEAARRGRGSAIYYLLTADAPSRWHRVDATEIWHFYLGAPLELEMFVGGERQTSVLGADIRSGERPQVAVPAGAWQRARSRHLTLVGCTVCPAFSFDGFELAPEGWSPED
jgi:uncharacterized protein